MPPQPMPAAGIRWRGEVPPQKWMNFYTKVLSRFVGAKGLSYGTLLPNIPFALAGGEQPLPAPPGGPAALRSPVDDRRGAQPQKVGNDGPSVPADFQGEVGEPLASAGRRRPPAALLQGRGTTVGGRAHRGDQVCEGAPLPGHGIGHLERAAHRLYEGGPAEDPLIPAVRLAPPAETGDRPPAPCQRSPYTEPPGSGMQIHPGSPIHREAERD